MTAFDDLAALADTATAAAQWLDDPFGMLADKVLPSGAIRMTVENSGAFEILGGLAYYEPPPPPELADEIGPNGYFGLTRKGRITALAAGAALVGWWVFK